MRVITAMIAAGMNCFGMTCIVAAAKSPIHSQSRQNHLPPSFVCLSYSFSLSSAIPIFDSRVARAFDLARTINERGCPILAFFARVGTMLPVARVLTLAKSHRTSSISPAPCSRQLSFQQARERRINAVMTQSGKPWVQRIGAWLYGLGSAVLTIVAFGGLYPAFRPRSLLIAFFVLWIFFSFVWRWVFFDRRAELNTKIPISSKELRRRKRDFFDSLSGH